MKYSYLSFVALCLGTKLVAAQCDVNKYCAYTYNNNNCAITTWNCDDCDVVVCKLIRWHSTTLPYEKAHISLTVYECNVDASCNPGATCVNNLCCHADQLPNGSADCPTTSDLQACGGFSRTVGTGSQAAWVPPHTDIPAELKCGC